MTIPSDVAKENCELKTTAEGNGKENKQQH